MAQAEQHLGLEARLDGTVSVPEVGMLVTAA